MFWVTSVDRRPLVTEVGEQAQSAAAVAPGHVGYWEQSTGHGAATNSAHNPEGPSGDFLYSGVRGAPAGTGASFRTNVASVPRCIRAFSSGDLAYKATTARASLG